MISIYIVGAFFASSTLAVQGGTISRKSTAYTSGYELSSNEGSPKYPFSGASYEYTGYGSAESSLEIENDGTLIYAPAFSKKNVGYATSIDNGSSWTMVVPAQGQPRTQPMFNIHDGRYFYWSSSMPGLQFSYSDDKGKTWKLVSKHLSPFTNDWAKIVSGKPVYSKLHNNASMILYMSAPSPISVGVGPIGPSHQQMSKSLDRGETWVQTKGAPTLSALKSGGACEKFTKNGKNGEYLIFSNGLVRPNGTVMYGLRRCQSLSIAISDDEGNSWRYSDVPGSSIVPYAHDLLTLVNHLDYSVQI
jgi:hypothetical protein